MVSVEVDWSICRQSRECCCCHRFCHTCHPSQNLGQTHSRKKSNIQKQAFTNPKQSRENSRIKVLIGDQIQAETCGIVDLTSDITDKKWILKELYFSWHCYCLVDRDLKEWGTCRLHTLHLTGRAIFNLHYITRNSARIFRSQWFSWSQVFNCLSLSADVCLPLLLFDIQPRICSPKLSSYISKGTEIYRVLRLGRGWLPIQPNCNKIQLFVCFPLGGKDQRQRHCSDHL